VPEEREEDLYCGGLGGFVSVRGEGVGETHPKRFFRVVHETNEQVGEDVELFPDPSTNNLCASIRRRHQHPGVYDGRKNAIQRINALEKDVRIHRMRGGIKKVNEGVQ